MPRANGVANSVKKKLPPIKDKSSERWRYRCIQQNLPKSGNQYCDTDPQSLTGYLPAEFLSFKSLRQLFCYKLIIFITSTLPPIAADRPLAGANCCRRLSRCTHRREQISALQTKRVLTAIHCTAGNGSRTKADIRQKPTTSRIAAPTDVSTDNSRHQIKPKSE